MPLKTNVSRVVLLHIVNIALLLAKNKLLLASITLFRT